MSWKDWFHKESIVMEEFPAEVLPLSPRLLAGIDLSRLSYPVRVFFEERVAITGSTGNMNGEGTESGTWEDVRPHYESEERWSFDQWLESNNES